MAAKQHLDQLKKQIEKLRSDSVSVVASANKIVYGGVQKLADRELKALNDYYKSAMASIKTANKSDLRGMASQQLDLLQDTVNQVISHARESMSIVADTRAELARLVQKGQQGEKVAVSKLNKAVAPAKKAVTKAKTAAQKAGKEAEKTVKKAASQAKAATHKATTQAKAVTHKASVQAKAVTQKAVAEGKRGASAAVKAVEHAIPAPSPNSRASRATSKAKQAATTAVETVSSAVSSLSSNVSNAVSSAVSKVTDAVKSQG